MLSSIFIVIRFPVFLIKIVFTFVLCVLFAVLDIVIWPFKLLWLPIVFVQAAFRNDSSRISAHLYDLHPIRIVESFGSGLKQDVEWLKRGG